MYDPRKVKRCAFCKRWEGDAKLKKGGNKGTVSFTDGIMGKCLKGHAPQPYMSGAGSNCLEYAISVEADKFL